MIEGLSITGSYCLLRKAEIFFKNWKIGLESILNLRPGLLYNTVQRRQTSILVLHEWVGKGKDKGWQWRLKTTFDLSKIIVQVVQFY